MCGSYYIGWWIVWGECIFTQARNIFTARIMQFVLSASLDFAFQFPDGIIVHISTGKLVHFCFAAQTNWTVPQGNNLHQSLLQSGINISTTSLQQLSEAGRIKCYTVQNILQLFSLAELLRTSFSASEKVLILFEGISNILFAQKVSYWSIITCVGKFHPKLI